MDLPISGDSSFFMSLYARYRKDPQSLPSDWMVYFETLDGPLRGNVDVSSLWGKPFSTPTARMGTRKLGSIR